MREENFDEEQISFATSFAPSDNEHLLSAREVYNNYYNEFKKTTDAEKEQVIAAGGLHIIGTERHESRRIDNQLRGRAGRQGDKGSSIFFLSLEDDLILRFGGDKLQKLADFLKIDDRTPLQMRMLSSQIEGAQKRIEAQNYASRKTVLQFDDVMSMQRQIIYGQRNEVLDGVDVHQQILDMFPEVVTRICGTYLDADKPYFEWDLDALNRGLEDKLFPKGTSLVTEEFVEDCEITEVIEKILEVIYTKYQENVNITKEAGVDFSMFERIILLRVVDTLWMDHIDQMQILRNEIGLQAYGQRDPVVEYKRQGFEMFDHMVDRIHDDITSFVLNVKIEVNKKMEMPKPKTVIPPQVIDNSPKNPVTSSKTTGRNDPCPCGSGKKYKNCCGK
jgi:preprotein translocase subunit SecA